MEKIYYYYVLKYINWVDRTATKEGVIEVNGPITSREGIEKLKQRIRGKESASDFKPLNFEVLTRL